MRLYAVQPQSHSACTPLVTAEQETAEIQGRLQHGKRRFAEVQPTRVTLPDILLPHLFAMVFTDFLVTISPERSTFAVSGFSP